MTDPAFEKYMDVVRKWLVEDIPNPELFVMVASIDGIRTRPLRSGMKGIVEVEVWGGSSHKTFRLDTDDKGVLVFSPELRQTMIESLLDNHRRLKRKEWKA